MKPEYQDITKDVIDILHNFPEDKRFEILNEVKLALTAELQARKNKLEAEIEFLKGITQLK